MLATITRDDIIEALGHAHGSLAAARDAGRDTTTIQTRIDELLDRLNED